MNLGLSGKKAIVCGASKGMGFAIAEKLVFEGADVALIARKPADLKKACDSLARYRKGKAFPFVFDLSQVSKIPQLVKQIRKKLGDADILINNTGGPPAGSFSEVSDEDWQKTYDQLLRSVIAMTREVIPGMKEKRFGRIVNIASQVVKEPQPRMILSNTIRSGVAAFAKTISFELAAYNITVNTLCPGAILTDRLVSLMRLRAEREKRSLEQVIEDVQNSIPMKRIGKPEEFADIAVFLASERASFITGTLIAVDGGITKSLM